jgi:hypothetical protein
VGKFSKIKKYSKPSLSVDEKIDKLNQELKKTGMLSEIANSTSGVYTITQYIEPVPAVPPTYSDTIVGYGLYIPPGGSIYSPGAYYYPIYELIDPGSPSRPGYTVVLSKNSLGDPNYFPGPIQPLGDVAGLGPLEVQTMLNIIRGTPGTPDAQRARDTLNRWAKPGSKNRDNLIKMGVLEQASAGGNMGDIAQSATGSGRMPYGTPGADKPFQIRGYKDSGGKVIDFDNPATWPSIKNQVRGV